MSRRSLDMKIYNRIKLQNEKIISNPSIKNQFISNCNYNDVFTFFNKTLRSKSFEKKEKIVPKESQNEKMKKTLTIDFFKNTFFSDRKIKSSSVTSRKNMDVGARIPTDENIITGQKLSVKREKAKSLIKFSKDNIKLNLDSLSNKNRCVRSQHNMFRNMPKPILLYTNLYKL